MPEELHETLSSLFRHLCHQDPLRTWSLGGTSVVVCQRCLGMYAGFFLSTAIQLAVGRPPRTHLNDALHAFFLLQMAAFGFGWIPDDPLVRTASGQVFAAGVVYFVLWPGRPRSVDFQRRRQPAYWGLTIASVVGLSLLCRIDASAVAALLNALALLGLVALAWLAVRGLALVVLAGMRSRGGPGSGPSPE